MVFWYCEREHVTFFCADEDLMKIVGYQNKDHIQLT